MKYLLLAALLSLGPGALADTSAACAELELLHPKKLVYPSSFQYKLTNNNYFDAASVKSPSCIFLPASAQDVSDAIKTVRKNNTQFALKSGGHMPGSFNNIDSGVLIATQDLSAMEWAENDEILRVGPGLRWGPVYKKAAEKDKIVVGGRLQQVGVGGLIVGGGISYVTGEHGFACDNVKGFEVVLANGTITYASETQHPDLFKALRGGTSNFGIVTRFDLDTYPLAKGWSNIGFKILRPSTKQQFLSAVTDYVTTGSAADLKSGAILTFTRLPNLSLDLGLISLWRSEPEPNPTLNPPPVFKQLMEVPAIHRTRNRTLTEIAYEFVNLDPLEGLPYADALQLQLRNSFRTGSYIADAELMREIEKIHFDEFEAIKDVCGLTSTITFQAIPPSAVKAGAAKRGGNVLGLEDRIDENSPPYMWTEQFVGWVKEKDTERVEEVQRIIWNRAKEAAEKRGLFDPFIYLNDASTEQAADVFPSYGEKNHQFLKTVKEKYDPSGVFTKLMPGGFKV